MPPLNRRIVANASAVLQAGFQPGGSIACPNAGSNVAAGTVPAWATSIWAYSPTPFKLAVGEVTSGSVGVPFPANVASQIGVAPGGTLNAQCIGAGGTIQYAYLGALT